MPVKKVMPKGGRKSSPTLWELVRAIPEDDWRQIKAFSMVYGKGSLQFKLLELLRSMEVYDPVVEKSTFEGHALHQLRRVARKWILRTGRRLALYQSEASEQVMDVGMSLEWGQLAHTMEDIEEARTLATEQEEYIWLDMLYHFEIAYVKRTYAGEERSKRVQEVAARAMANAKLLLLKAEIEQMVAKYLEHGRNQLLSDGRIDEGFVSEYFDSAFYKQVITEWPLSFQIQRLRIDEAMHYYRGDTAKAASVAERLLTLTQQLEGLRQGQTEDHSRIMFRLSAYYTDLRDMDRLLGIMDRFKELLEVPSAFRVNYLRRAIHIYFNTAFLNTESLSLQMKELSFGTDAKKNSE